MITNPGGTGVPAPGQLTQVGALAARLGHVPDLRELRDVVHSRLPGLIAVPSGAGIRPSRGRGCEPEAVVVIIP